MKSLYTVLTLFAFFFLSCTVISAQKTFDPASYMQFLQENKTLTTSQLLENNAPKTTYYSNRMYPAELKTVPWFASIESAYELTPEEQELLANNHFMVSQRLKNWDWASAFIGIYSNDLPLFISSDFVLHTLHKSYDVILQTLEWQFLEPNLMDLLKAMYDSYPAIYTKYSSDERFSDALEDIDLYVSVARSLLHNSEYLPQKHTSDKFNEVMQAVNDEQMAFITLFTDSRLRKIDFSQFKPRGHYNKTIYTNEGERKLENYFRAMMWLGRIDFLLTAPPDNPWEPDLPASEFRWESM